jgi:UDP-2,3-diacylglucosamine pyrophosphatase LpxH
LIVQRQQTHVRALFLSDVHLGSRACKSDRLIDFLHHHVAETIYLVGDIVDGWRLSSQWYWPQAHNDILQELLHAARRGVRVVYIPGNHDEFLRAYCGMHYGGIEVADSVIHVAADGRRYLVIHGDCFDRMTERTRRFADLGDRANRAMAVLNAGINRARGHLGLPYWPFSQWAKSKVKGAVQYVSAFENALSDAARRNAADGVICGHIHHAVIRDACGVRYVNCGDWVDSCTAAAEFGDGCFRILNWNEAPRAAAGSLRVAEAAA